MTAKLLNLTCSPYSSLKPLLFPKYLFTYYGLFCFVLLTEGCGIVYLLFTVYIYRVSKKKGDNLLFSDKTTLYTYHTFSFRVCIFSFFFSCYNLVHMPNAFYFPSLVLFREKIKDSLFYNIFAVFFALKQI